MTVQITRSNSDSESSVLIAKANMNPDPKMVAHIAPPNPVSLRGNLLTRTGTRILPAAIPAIIRPAPEGRGEWLRSLRIGTTMLNSGTTKTFIVAVNNASLRNRGFNQSALRRSRAERAVDFTSSSVARGCLITKKIANGMVRIALAKMPTPGSVSWMRKPPSDAPIIAAMPATAPRRDTESVRSDWSRYERATKGVKTAVRPEKRPKTGAASHKTTMLASVRISTTPTNDHDATTPNCAIVKTLIRPQRAAIRRTFAVAIPANKNIKPRKMPVSMPPFPLEAYVTAEVAPSWPTIVPATATPPTVRKPVPGHFNESIVMIFIAKKIKFET